jgi:uncharacterized protein
VFPFSLIRVHPLLSALIRVPYPFYRPRGKVRLLSLSPAIPRGGVMTGSEPDSTPKWTILEALERRVLGVLVEKAKTTPDVYPLSLNGLRNGCNQKNNRYPQLQVEEDAVEDALDSLRKKGAVAVIEGMGRVEKYRHLAKDWFGIEKEELAVMTELLLRGAQTVGELRVRAARMEPIKGLDELAPVLESLARKKLIVYLSPPGRGAVVTHNLYHERELDKVRRDAATEFGGSAEPVTAPAAVAPPRPAPVAAPLPDGRGSNAPAASPIANEQIAELRRELTEIRIDFSASISELQAELAELKRQLGA